MQRDVPCGTVPSQLIDPDNLHASLEDERNARDGPAQAAFVPRPSYCAAVLRHAERPVHAEDPGDVGKRPVHRRERRSAAT
jgi:hypothetical protein